MSVTRQPPKALLYPPEDQPFLQWFGADHEAVYVVFHPFVRMPVRSAKYPEDEAILRSGRRVEWREVASQAGLDHPHGVNLGLLSAIGALRDQFRDPAAASKLEDLHLRTGTLWFPPDGKFPPLLWRSFLGVFTLARESDVRVVDQAGSEASMSLLDLLRGDTLLKPLLAKVGMPGRTLYPASRRFLFCVHWDSFFTLFCGPRAFLQEAVTAERLEGFFCDPATEHFWSLPGRGDPPPA